jgi:hypothetical protein
VLNCHVSAIEAQLSCQNHSKLSHWPQPDNNASITAHAIILMSKVLLLTGVKNCGGRIQLETPTTPLGEEEGLEASSGRED